MCNRPPSRHDGGFTRLVRHVVHRLNDKLSDLNLANGPSGEMRRFASGIRAITSALASVMLMSRSESLGASVGIILFAYCAWSAYALWSEARGHSFGSSIWAYCLDVAWSCAMLRLLDIGTMMLVLSLVNPIVIVSIGYGVRRGLALAIVAACGIALDSSNYLVRDLSQGWAQRLPAILVLVLVPMTALVARPMSVLRRRIALIGDLGLHLDPRRGLEPVCTEIVERLREGTAADVVALVLPSDQGAPALLSTLDDGSFRAKHDVHARFEALLVDLPPGAVSFVRRPWWDPRRSLVGQIRARYPAAIVTRLRELAETLDVRSLHVVPLSRYGKGYGHFVVGYQGTGSRRQDLSALAGAATELLRIIEQAALVDQLQDETAAHERARIGRDLHDSAIQPYLGLKYAVESVALRIARDNPARAEVDSLAELVNGEVSALRELISGLRTGNESGDNALVPAVRRQVKRFALLFGIEVTIDCPDALPTTRATATALFHMVNEALNNIRKHTQAQRVWIALALVGGRFRLVVRDDAGTRAGRPARDFHPSSLSERVAELNGQLTVSRPDGLNNELSIEIPLT